MKTIFKSDNAVIKSDFPTPEDIEQRFSKSSNAQKIWTQYLKYEFLPYVPFQTGLLARSADLHSTPTAVIYNTPYARRLYYNPGYKFTTTFNINAGAFWDRRAAMARQTNFWEPYLRRLIAKNLGGK